MLGLGLGLQKSTRVGGFIGLLDLFPNAAAAYSLRKLRAAYSGSAVRVRRSSDNTEQDIGFTTQGELDTTSLLSFVNEDVDVYTSDFISSIDGWGNNNMTLSSNQTIGGSSGWLECEATTDSGILKRAKAPISLEAGCTYTIQSKVYVESGNNVGGLYIGADGNGLLVSTTDTDEVVELSVTFTATTGGDLEWFMTDSSLNPYFTGGLGKSIYIKDTIITQTTADGHVKTWYDQSGNSNDATQGTPTAQPKIVSGGAVITEGTSAKPAIDFDVSGIYLATSAIPEVTQPATHIATLKYTSGETSEIPFSSLSDVNGRNLSYKGNSNYAMFAGSVFESATAVTNDQQLNFSLFNGASSSMWKDGTLIIDNESVGTETIEGITIGSDHDANPDFFGKIQEYMVYASDQSSNRTAIETNINTFYSIYP
jgi:hypothetical protein